MITIKKKSKPVKGFRSGRAFRRKLRVLETVYTSECTDYSPEYVCCIQSKIHGLWTMIWSESSPVSDGDRRACILGHANEIIRKLACQS